MSTKTIVITLEESGITISKISDAFKAFSVIRIGIMKAIAYVEFENQEDMETLEFTFEDNKIEQLNAYFNKASPNFEWPLQIQTKNFSNYQNQIKQIQPKNEISEIKEVDNPTLNSKQAHQTILDQKQKEQTFQEKQSELTQLTQAMPKVDLKKLTSMDQQLEEISGPIEILQFEQETTKVELDFPSQTEIKGEEKIEKDQEPKNNQTLISQANQNNFEKKEIKICVEEQKNISEAPLDKIEEKITVRQQSEEQKPIIVIQKMDNVEEKDNKQIKKSDQFTLLDSEKKIKLNEKEEKEEKEDKEKPIQQNSRFEEAKNEILSSEPTTTRLTTKFCNLTILSLALWILWVIIF